MNQINCIVYPPTVDYDYMPQRPQHLMREFSEMQIPAYYMNINLFKKRKGIEQINPYFFLFNNVNIKPFLKNTRPVIYFSLPDHINIVKQYKPSLLVFDSIDEPSEEFASWRHHYRKALELADVVLASSEKLYRMAASVNKNTYLIPNACDYDHFSQAVDNPLNLPEDMKGLRGPIIGFMGAIASWCDLELLDRLAVNFPDCNIVLVGPLYNVQREQVPAKANIHWLGIKTYKELPAYLQAFDVGIVPFRLSSMIESVNPIKMWEYLAAGLPVVTTAFPEAQKHSDVVLYSENEEEFMNNINVALYDDKLEKQARRVELARQNSWSSRARQIISIIEDKLAQNSYFQTADLPLFSPGKVSQKDFQNIKVTLPDIRLMNSSNHLNIVPTGLLRQDIAVTPQNLRAFSSFSRKPERKDSSRVLKITETSTYKVGGKKVSGG